MKTRTKEKRDICKQNGICPECRKNTPKPGFVNCDDCLKKIRKWRAQRAKNNKAKGICIRCTKKPAKIGCVMCKDCLAEDYEYHKKKIEKKLAKGICIACSKKALKHSRYCEEHLIKAKLSDNKISRKLFKEVKQLLIEQNYKCVYTGEKLILGLNASLDHIKPKSREGTNDINNLQWTTKAVNLMKRDFTETEFLRLVERVYLSNINPEAINMFNYKRNEIFEYSMKKQGVS